MVAQQRLSIRVVQTPTHPILLANCSIHCLLCSHASLYGYHHMLQLARPFDTPCFRGVHFWGLKDRMKACCSAAFALQSHTHAYTHTGTHARMHALAWLHSTGSECQESFRVKIGVTHL
eukprot:1034474-Pelagomonas_calceolata.AAC.4